MTQLLLRIDAAARQAAPIALTLLLLLISALPATMPIFREAAPAWVLISVFYWSVYRPDLMPIQAVFVIGLLQDFALGLPVGGSALLYVTLRGSSAILVRVANGRGFVGVWILFAGAASAVLIARYLVMILWYERLIGPMPVVTEWLLTIGAYPLVGWLLTHMRKGLLHSV